MQRTYCFGGESLEKQSQNVGNLSSIDMTPHYSQLYERTVKVCGTIIVLCLDCFV